MHETIDRIDRRIAEWMERYGHRIHRLSLGLFFVWMGLLKQFGVKTTSSLLAHTIWWGDPDVMVPLLGWWEVIIGVSLIFRVLIRAALLLLFLRLPGTLFAMILLPDICFVDIPFAPSPEGQYLIKDLMLFGAAIVIGGTVRVEKSPDIYH